MYLEAVLDMTGGYVLDFSNASFANFFRELNIDIYDIERYPGFGDSKANRIRALWKGGSEVEISASLHALAEYLDARKAAGVSYADITDEQVERIRTISQSLMRTTPEERATSPANDAHATFTTEATLAANKIQIEIHEDIYNHIDQYLANGDYFHAVEESYKLVRESLREKTGSEKATDAFSASNQEKIFGHAPQSAAEKDFYDGVKYLNMSIQFLRNEKAHTPAAPLEPNLALHYISVASLAYDLITRYVSDDVVQKTEELISAKRRSLSASAFYRLFKGGKWLESIDLPDDLNSLSVRKVLKKKWLAEVDFTRSYDHSNIMVMRLEVVADALTKADLDHLLELPTVDAHGNDQEAGMLPFLEYMQQQFPEKMSNKSTTWIEDKLRENET
ncbi:TIGR02391 family protein [Arthrobacter sp. E3]|uniref:TIGR02391 family protein n=1 Tax=Arthrobacter sp. E3 TaxID=517402 RepID=UPI001A940471|nr:TIGR02391 family protein [Arthrobacter sp. E3]